jgi:hypothetical protein
VKVTLPLRTVSTLNQREHWAQRQKRTRDHRGAAMIFSLSSLKKAPGGRVCLPVVVRLTRVAPSSGLDGDNLQGALKAVRDGVADALGVDDRDSRVRWEYAQRRGAPKRYAVEIEILQEDS